MGKEKAADPSKCKEENIIKAIKDVTRTKMGVNEASRLNEYLYVFSHKTKHQPRKVMAGVSLCGRL